MSKKTSSRSPADTVETIQLQLAMAFGQGAGTALATGEALDRAAASYRLALERRVSDWPELAPRTLEFSRALGRVAAARAAAGARCVIDVTDVDAALRALRRNTAAPLGICQLTIMKDPSATSRR